MSPAGSKNAPEARAREKIDALLDQAGWIAQDRDEMNLAADTLDRWLQRAGVFLHQRVRSLSPIRFYSVSDKRGKR